MSEHTAPQTSETTDTPSGSDTSLPNSVSKPNSSGFLIVSTVLVGGALQGYANGTPHAIVAAFILFVVGAFITSLAFRKGRAELRGFRLSFSVSVLAGGLVQCYSLHAFGAPQDFVDAVGFFNAIFEDPPYYSWQEINELWIDGAEVSRGAPLAIAIWQWLYHVRLLLGLDFGMYFGVMVNAMFIGWTTSITVRIAREIFGDDAWRLNRVGTLSAFCGLLILFGALLLRDCFTTFLNAVVLLAVVCWLKHPNLRRSILGGVLTILAIAAMSYLRSRTLVLFGAVWFLGFSCWFISKKFDVSRVLISVVVLVLAAASFPYLISYLDISKQLHDKYSEQYGGHMGENSQDGSLAMSLIVNQPIPIRVVLGSASMTIRPIPLWAGLEDGASEYHWIKGYNGFYQIIVMPLFLAGLLLVAKQYLGSRQSTTPLFYVAVYFVVMVASVVLTSMEQRHVAQFMPAFMILAAVPDTRDKKDRKVVNQMGYLWYCLVGLVHLAWAIAASGR